MFNFDKPLSNFDLLKICNKLGIPIAGIYSKDELYNIQKVNGMYIVNMQNSNDGMGTHWVCIIKRNNTSLYFDSFGFVPPIAVMDFLRPSIIGYSVNDIQYLKSILCGYFCIAWLKFLQPYINNTEKLLERYDDFIELFSEVESKNDKILKKILKL